MICLFQHGGPSQMDLFDPKPVLSQHHGKPYPGSLEIHFDKQAGKLLASPFRFRPHGQSGIVLSELLPHIARIADDLTLVRSMTTESVDHEAALRLIHTGKVLAGRPTWGSWVVYGAREREPELAGLRGPVGPGRFAGRRSAQLVERLAAGDRSGNPVSLGGRRRCSTSRRRQASRPRLANASFAFSTSSTRRTSKRHPGDSELEARIANFEIAAAMQTAVPEALDLSREIGSTPGACTAWTTRPPGNTAAAA